VFFLSKQENQLKIKIPSYVITFLFSFSHEVR